MPFCAFGTFKLLLSNAIQSCVDNVFCSVDLQHFGNYASVHLSLWVLSFFCFHDRYYILIITINIIIITIVVVAYCCLFSAVGNVSLHLLGINVETMSTMQRIAQRYLHL